MYSVAWVHWLTFALMYHCMTSCYLYDLCRSVVPLLQVLSRGIGDSLYDCEEGGIHSLRLLLSTFSSFYHHSALTLHDKDFMRRSSFLPGLYTDSLFLASSSFLPSPLCLCVIGKCFISRCEKSRLYIISNTWHTLRVYMYFKPKQTLNHHQLFPHESRA